MNYILSLFSSGSSSSTDMSTVKEVVESSIAENSVMVFSKSYCPYCRRAKGLLDSLNVKYTAIELDNREDGGDIQQYLAQKTGQRTVPNIFIKQQHIGGCDDLHAKNANGSLKPLLSQL
ncbi:thioredoxin-like protein [Cladochytrium replicatum]|nr:thioredoxin-like protein [Cladochytrium replicatum]